MVVFGEHLARGLAAAIAQRDRRQLFLQASGLVGVVGALLRAQRELVLHLARDALLLGVKLGGVAPCTGRSSCPCSATISESSSLPSPRPTPQRMPRMTCGACDMDSMPPASTILASPSWIICAARDDRLHARSAETVDGERRNFDGNSGFEGDVTRAVDGVARSLLRVAEDGVVDFAGLDAGAFHGFDGGDGAQFLGGEVAKLSAVAAHGRAGAVDDSDINCVRHVRMEGKARIAETFEFISRGRGAATARSRGSGLVLSQADQYRGLRRGPASLSTQSL